VINGQTCNYNKGDLFILPPQASHFFIFTKRTAICVVKFHEGFFEDFLQDSEFERLLSQSSSLNRKITWSDVQQKQVVNIMELLMFEHRKVRTSHNFIIKSALALVIALVSGNKQAGPVKIKDEKIQGILNFIDKHIKNKPILTVQNIAQQFNISKTYFNQYFTKATGSSYKKYVQQYALNLIAQQLVQQNKTLSQLAFEYGYSDESHLSNAFKSHFGQSPTAFLKEKLK